MNYLGAEKVDAKIEPQLKKEEKIIPEKDVGKSSNPSRPQVICSRKKYDKLDQQYE